MYDLKIRVIMTNVLIELVYFHFCGMNMKWRNHNLTVIWQVCLQVINLFFYH
jgi:hypothetical protein